MLRLTVRHHAYFVGGELGQLRGLTSPAAWDALRLGTGSESPYALPEDRLIWVRRASEDEALVDRAKQIAEIARAEGVRRVMSVGVGCGWVEYNLKRLMPELHLTCTDFAEGTVERLRSLFVECDEIAVFDMIGARWPSTVDLVLMHRVDTELDNVQWQGVFSAIHSAGVERVLFLPAGLLTWRALVGEMAKRLAGRLDRRPMVFAGYLRSWGTFRSLWADHYVMERRLHGGGLTGCLLRARG